MKEKVIDIVSDVLKMDKPQLLEQFEDPNVWDSMLKVEILFAVEDEFNVTFESDEITRITSPQKICEVLSEKVSG